MIWKIQKKSKLNSEKTWKLWKKSKLKSEKIWKIQKKSKLNSEKIGKIWKEPSWIVKWFGKYGRKVGWIVKWYGKFKCFKTSCTRKASNVAFQTSRFEKVWENEMFYNVTRYKSRLNSEMIWKIQKKIVKKIWKIWKKSR